MTDERQPRPDGRPAVNRKRMRPRPNLPAAKPGIAGTRIAAPAVADDDDRSPATGERMLRPWEVEGTASAAAVEASQPGDDRPVRHRRRTVASLLADVPEDAVIVTRRLTKKYGDFTAVDSLDLTIRAGEVFGLLGPNGAGKTTTVLMLLGLTEATKGVVRVVGMDPAREPLGVKRVVGYLPDNVGFYDNLTGRENLRYTAKLNGIARSAAEARINELLSDVRLEDAADKPAGTYSRGMRQRLGIADALVKSPTVLILDEPTIAIDPAGVEELLALIRKLVVERTLTVLLSSHILGQVQSLCDRVGFFSAGRLIAAGPLDELAAGADRTIELEVGIEGVPEDIDPIARALPGVRSVEPDAHNERFRIVTSTADVAAPLASSLAGAGLTLVHLRRRRADLLDLYRRFVPEGLDGR